VVVDSGRVLVWRREGAQLAGVIRAERARWAAPAPGDEILVACQGGTDLRRYDQAGRFRGVLRTGARGEVIGLRTGPERTVWLLTDDGGRLTIHRGGHRRPFRAATLDELAAALPPSALTAADDDGFCLSEQGPDGPRDHLLHLAGPAPGPRAARHRRLRDQRVVRHHPDRQRHLALPLAPRPRGRRRARRHGRRRPDRGVRGRPVRRQRLAGIGPGATDFLVDQPPGRFLRLRLRLSGDGAATPVVRRIRLDFPRVTSADLLPPAFRQDPAADDFTERFLSLFDATLAELDRVIERYPALLDPAGVPDRVLPWLAGLLGLSFEAGWDADPARAAGRRPGAVPAPRHAVGAAGGDHASCSG
jgi:hypothetical protein